MDQHTQSPDNKENNLQDILLRYLSQWWWFVISFVLFIIAGYLYLKTCPVIYRCTTAVLIKQDKSGSEEQAAMQDLMGLRMGTNNIDNEIGLFRSYNLSMKVVTSLELYTSYHYVSKYGFYNPDLYKESPLYVRWENIEPYKIPGTVKMIFTPKEKGYSVKITNEDVAYREEIFELTADSLPTYLNLPFGRFYVTLQEGKTLEQPLKVTIRNAMDVAISYVKGLRITPSTKQSSVLDFSFNTRNRERGKDYLQALIRTYNEEAIADKNLVAYNTALFVDERLKAIAEELGSVEGEVEKFRKENKVTDITTEARLFIEQNATNEQKRLEIETQLNLIRFIEEFIHRPENRTKLIPNLGIQDMGLLEIINAYNTLLIERERISSSTSGDNPVMIQANEQVESLRKSIITALANEQHASEIALQDLSRQDMKTLSRIGSIPSIDREYTDILRRQEVKNNLYTFLLQKREEISLNQAGISPKAKIISIPLGENKPVEPKPFFILFLFGVIGLAFPAGIFFVRDLFRLKISGMEDLNALRNAKTIGDIAKQENNGQKSSLVVSVDDDSGISEMFRTMRSNLLFMLSGTGKVITVTSTIPGEGKTFVAVNLAKSFSLMEKKVLLIGADLRNPQISHSIGIPKQSKGLSAYLAGLEKNFHELIVPLEKNLFVMQTGAIPPNPNELLAKPELDDLIAKLRDEFDYIIIDSAPVGVVSDTFVLSRTADATVYVVRENYSRKDSITFINSIVEEKRLPNLAVVLNFASLTKNGHSRYKYGYRYSYQYAYKYGKKREKK